MSPGSSTDSYPAFARNGLRENPGKNLNQVTCPDWESNPGHLVSRPDVLTVTPQVWTVYMAGQQEGILLSHGEPYDLSSSPFFPVEHRAALIQCRMNIKRPRLESRSAPDAQP
ncbi:hypothetical protein ANN_01068 [Periplaneta americana]|uniref:Uncharacterized protein n=1 Tax=Periplaneta americana TaxID=6978 RepID=A0ABQ8TSJ6_PERAM|nr:hypothetical protein ANN_01068 [Periplaneta americana]